MAKQPEQILEEQLVTQLQWLGYVFVLFILFKSIKINNIKKNTLKKFIEFKKGVTFASTVPLLLPVRSAQGSFFFIGFASKSTQLFCLTLMQIEEVFSFNNNLYNG